MVRIGRLKAAGVALVLAVLAPRAFAGGGDLDLTFGNGGTVRETSILDPYGRVFAVAIGLDGSIYAAGDDRTNNPALTSRWALFKFSPNGSLDTRFGTGGKAVLFGGPRIGGASPPEVIRGVAVDVAGRIVVVGPRYVAYSAKNVTGWQPDIAVARFLPTGTLDPTFAVGGIYTANLAETATGADVAFAVDVQADGKTVVGGGLQSRRGDTDIFVLRLDAQGARDPSFGTGGLLVHRLSSGDENVQEECLRVDRTGRIVVAGPSGANQMVFARYTSTGRLDATFGSGGVARPSWAGIADPQVRGMDVDADGNVVLAGFLYSSNPALTLVARLQAATGAVDPTFNAGRGRWLSSEVPGSVGHVPAYGGLAALSDGGVVVATNYVDGVEPNNPITVFRLRSDGTTDGLFGSGGMAMPAAPGLNTPNFPASISEDADGRVLVGGFTTLGYTLTLARWMGR